MFSFFILIRIEWTIGIEDQIPVKLSAGYEGVQVAVRHGEVQDTLMQPVTKFQYTSHPYVHTVLYLLMSCHCRNYKSYNIMTYVQSCRNTYKY